MAQTLEEKKLYYQEYRKKYPERVQKIQRRSKYKRLYGITLEQFDEILLEQENKCYLCNIEFQENSQYNVDHDHETGKVRSILCTYCNLRMSVVDDEEFLQKAILYREKHRKGKN